MKFNENVLSRIKVQVPDHKKIGLISIIGRRSISRIYKELSLINRIKPTEKWATDVKRKFTE